MMRRYMTRPAVCVERLTMRAAGKIEYKRKNQCSNGATHVLFSPLDFLGRLAALIPRQRYNVMRYHGDITPNSTLRSCTVPRQRKKSKKKGESGGKGNVCLVSQSEQDFLAPLTWAQRLKCIYRIDITQCQRYGRSHADHC
jgi:hypothetical protein